MKSIPWVRCASSNVFKCVLKALAQEGNTWGQFTLTTETAVAQFVQRQFLPKIETQAVLQRQFCFLCGKYMRTIYVDNRDSCRTICSAAALAQEDARTTLLLSKIIQFIWFGGSWFNIFSETQLWYETGLLIGHTHILFYFIFQLLVQKHKIFNIKGVSKVSFTCGYSHWTNSDQTK